ncbi:MAG: polysaccharide deacetylase family protein [Alphaproteobacteria bacterium]|nr:polysaccharide deacetylase family protein [Alphaproteobacteria bacterium]
MENLKYFLYRVMFEILWASQAGRLVRALSRSYGVIFTVHRVLPEAGADFSPNAILQITPQFLEYAILRVRQLGFETVSLDEAIKRLEGSKPARKFVVFTFDDAYRDNLEHALPVLKRHRCPFTLYVPTALVDGVGQVWWQALEDIIGQQDALALGDERGEIQYFDTKTVGQKKAAYRRIYSLMRQMDEDERVGFILEIAQRYGLDLQQHCRQLIMDWGELKTFADEPLCTIGAHTVHHYELAKLKPERARQEIEQSLQVIYAQFGVRPRHLSYPIGGKNAAGKREFEIARDLGLRSGVTTRPGGLYKRHKQQLLQLPRVSLNGLFQNKRYVEVLATGAIFSMMSGG